MILSADWPDLPGGIKARYTDRRAGMSVAPYDDGQGGGGFNLGVAVGDDPEAVRANREALRAQLPCEPAWLRQVHGTTVVDAACAASNTPADASIADRSGVVCVVQTADCLPVLFADTNGCVVGAAHAGWRGLAAGVLENTVAAMRARGSDEILAWLGPAIGPSCFEVGEDVLDAFPATDCETFRPVERHLGKYWADIYTLARRALKRVGVERVAAGGAHCTYSDPTRFYSFRREAVTGRMASLIWIAG